MLLSDLPADLVADVIVVDSNSNDGTPEIACKDGRPRCSGTAPRILASLSYRASHGKFPDVVVFLDGDYSDRTSELPILVAPITEGRADITLGSASGSSVLLGRCPGIRYSVIASPSA